MNRRSLLLFSLSALAGRGDLKETKRFLREVKLPEGRFSNATLEEVIDFLRIRSIVLDPKGEGINVNLLGDISYGDPGKPLEIPAAEPEEIFLKDFSFKDLSFQELLVQITKGSGYSFSVTRLGVVLQSDRFQPSPTPLADALPPEIKKTLQALIIPDTNLVNCTLGEASDYLTFRARELAGEGGGFVVTKSPHWKDERTFIINQFRAKNASFADLVDFFARSFHLDYEVRGGTIILSQIQEEK